MNQEKSFFKNWAWWGVSGGVLLTLLLYHASIYFPFIADDALISLRYASRFLQGEGLTWTAGERVEGYSNLAWILGVSSLGYLGLDLITATRALGLISIIMALAALNAIVNDIGKTAQRSIWFAASLILCSAPPIAVWVVGGLEQIMYIAALLWFVRGVNDLLNNDLLSSQSMVSNRVLISSGLAGGVLCVTRPDGPLFIIVFATYYVLREVFLSSKPVVSHESKSDLDRSAPSSSLSLPARLWRGAPLIFIPLLFTLTQLLFRLWYYEEWLPNIAHIKVSISTASWMSGVEYIKDAWSVLYPLTLPALLSLRSKHRSTIFFSWFTLAMWTIYVMSVGGDIFPGHRHLVVVIALLSLLTAYGLSSFDGRKAYLISTTFIILCGWQSFSLSQESKAYQIAKMERWEWDGKIIGEWLRESFLENDPLLAVTAAGTLPYFTKFRSLDMQGLNDRHIALQPAKKGYALAHDHGDGDYVLSRQPDLIAFRGIGLGIPAFVSGDEMKKTKEFIIRYRQRSFEGQYPKFVASKLFVRLDGVLGVRSSKIKVDLPPYLFRKSIGSPAPSFGVVKESERGDDVVDFLPPVQHQAASNIIARWPLEEIMYLNNFPLSPGQWSVSLDPPYPFRIQKYGQIGRGSANLGIQILTSAEALTQAMPKTYKRGQEVFVRRVTLKKIGEAAHAIFLASGENLAKAQKLEQEAVLQSSMRVLDDFEGEDTVSENHQSEWHGKWYSTSSIAKYITRGKVKRQNRVKRYSGQRLFNTFTTRLRDRATVRVWSPKVQLPPHAVLSFKVGGGQLNRGGGVRLWIDGIAIGTWAGKNSETLSQVHLDLRLFVGQELQVELIDQGRGEWGHILVDDLWLSQHIYSAREKARYEDPLLK